MRGTDATYGMKIYAELIYAEGVICFVFIKLRISREVLVYR